MSTDPRGSVGLGLTPRLQILTAFAIVLSALAIGGASYRSALSALNQSLHAHGRALADVTAQNAEYALFTRDEQALSALLIAVTSDPVVDYASVHDAQGKVLLQAKSTNAPIVLSEFDRSSSSHEVQGVSRRWMEVSAPVLSISTATSPDGMGEGEKKIIGFLRFGLGFGALEAHAREQLFVTGGVMTLMLLFSGLLILLMSRRITRPLSELAQGVRQVAVGNLESISISAGIAEIDELAGAFNRMTEELARLALIEQQHRLTTERSLLEKETMLMEIHHRVKNNLQVIVSLMTLQLYQTDNDVVRGILMESAHRVKSMALIHQQLYGSENLDRVDFANYAERLGHSLRALFCPTARIKYELVPLDLPVATAVPLGLILNELLTNAIKYGMSVDHSTPFDVGVRLTEEDGQVRLDVWDHGPGLPESVTNHSHSTLGMDIVRGLSRQLRAQFVVESHRGAHFSITCPRPGDDESSPNGGPP